MSTQNRYDFDTVIDRRNTGSLKYDFGRRRAGYEDLLPLWVADMDFRLPDEILDALHERVDHGIFGYTEPDGRYYEALRHWFETQHGYQIESEWNTVVPGVVYGIAAAIRACTSPGDAVLIQQPVYYPFSQMILQNGRKCVNSELSYENGAYRIDYGDFEEKLTRENVKLFILCSPHNPVGRVWKKEELLKLAEICLRHNVTVIADEIHCDFIYPGHTFVSWATLPQEYQENAVVCTSPSKTFNLAGLQIANLLIRNRSLRRRFRQENAANGYGECNTLGLTAARAAYEKGLPWLTELKVYLKENVDTADRFLQKELPQIRLVMPEGTYLLWLDCSGLRSDPEELEQLVRGRAKLWLDDGGMFGETTKLFERINIACPRSILTQALEQLRAAAQE